MGYTQKMKACNNPPPKNKTRYCQQIKDIEICLPTKQSVHRLSHRPRPGQSRFAGAGDSSGRFCYYPDCRHVIRRVTLDCDTATVGMARAGSLPYRVELAAFYCQRGAARPDLLHRLDHNPDHDRLPHRLHAGYDPRENSPLGRSYSLNPRRSQGASARSCSISKQRSLAFQAGKS